ncbi:MAG TPA: YHS domain-containing protein [Bacteroidia bacterium]|jgi:YHS domain-containing protein|nr:YHS domain-containing protein [Bacteroidia bacterium]
MKTKRIYSIVIGIILCLSFSFAFTNKQASTVSTVKAARDSTLCPVCGMKVNFGSSYDLKYEKTTYYFDTYNCKETFKMDPKKFLNNVCTPGVKQ